MKLGILNNWYVTYYGKIYGNFPTSIHDRINNKAKIRENYFLFASVEERVIYGEQKFYS